ncbi:MAG: SocA family protein [Candidatus Doudnabacteria bacterium]|nr:SocA family protein [Candidatus Doudnabacteria bacterium]
MSISIPKLKAILLYFAENTNARFLGKVKLMKLFYFLDFMHLKNFGTPVTGDTYIKLDHGPIPSTIKNLIDDAAENIETSELQDTIYFERPIGLMYQVKPTRKLTEDDRKLFSPNEIEILEKVCKRYGNSTMKEIESASHEEAPWAKSKMYDVIPYTLAAQDSDSQFSEEELDLIKYLN